MLLNLITNAREELIESEGERQIEVQTAETDQDGKRFVAVSVADSGSGVPADLRDRIFDPFFTTKQYGSGVGFSICHRIVSDHHGFLHVMPSKWGGALFVAKFPVDNKAAD
jgi:C4-dicarboxylate-specific signal transduction histidine kinase